MKKKEVIEALKMIIDALESGEEKPEKVNHVPEKVIEEPNNEKSDSKGEVSFNEEELKGMKYADLKKLASELGVSAKGKRDEIISRIMSGDVEVAVAEEKEMDNIVPFPVDKAPVDYLALAKEATEDMSLEEIRELLEDLGLDSEGKKKELIDRIAKAMEDGIIEIDDEEDEEDEEDTDSEEEVEEDEEEEDEDEDDEDDDEEEDDEDGEEIDENSYFEDFDDGTNSPDDIDSEERKKAVVKLQKDVISDYENGALTDKDIDEFLKTSMTDDELEDLEEADETDKFMAYCELLKRMIDDDGERMSMKEPYEITVDGEVYDYCCGHELEETDEGYICEVCGTVYESEE